MLLLPHKTPYSFRLGDEGLWGVFALQVALNSFRVHQGLSPLTVDGNFGMQTLWGVRTFQRRLGLAIDGVPGPHTQAMLVLYCIDLEDTGVPKDLLKSVVGGEGGLLIAPVNWTVVGGVDLGATQRRVVASWYDGWPTDSKVRLEWLRLDMVRFDAEDLERALDARHQIRLLRRRITTLRDHYLDPDNQRQGVLKHPRPREFATRLAVLNHNYPYAADKISRVGTSGLSSYWTKPATWVESIGAKFPDGWPIRTPLEWCQHYSLGSERHQDPGFMVRLVTSWG